MGDKEQRPELSTVRAPSARPDPDEWLEEVALRRALRRMGVRWLKTSAIALAGAGGGAGLATMAEAPTSPAPLPVAVEVSTKDLEADRCQVSAQTELTCARAVHDARTAIDYFAILADACELPRDARPSDPK